MMYSGFFFFLRNSPIEMERKWSTKVVFMYSVCVGCVFMSVCYEFYCICYRSRSLVWWWRCCAVLWVSQGWSFCLSVCLSFCWFFFVVSLGGESGRGEREGKRREEKRRDNKPMMDCRLEETCILSYFPRESVVS